MREDLAHEEIEIYQTQVALALRQAEEGIAIGEISRNLEINEQTYYRWRKNYGGPMPSEMNENSMEQTRELDGKNC
jgi:putative transposase